MAQPSVSPDKLQELLVCNKKRGGETVFGIVKNSHLVGKLAQLNIPTVTCVQIVACKDAPKRLRDQDWWMNTRASSGRTYVQVGVLMELLENHQLSTSLHQPGPENKIKLDRLASVPRTQNESKQQLPRKLEDPKSHEGPGNDITPVVIYIAPLREMVIQNYEAIQSFTEGTDLVCRIFTGGKSYAARHTGALRGCHYLCITFGALTKLIKKQLISLKDLKFLIMDEAQILLKPEAEGVPNDHKAALEEIFLGEKYDLRREDHGGTVCRIFLTASQCPISDWMLPYTRNVIDPRYHLHQEWCRGIGGGLKLTLVENEEESVDQLTFLAAYVKGHLTARNVIVFAHSIKDMKLIEELLKALGETRRTFVTGAHRQQSDRENIKNQMRGPDYVIIIAWKVVAEGMSLHGG